jgi:hypothetical protein
MLFNKAFGSFSAGLPFDVDRDRAASYDISDDPSAAAQQHVVDQIPIHVRTAIKRALANNLRRGRSSSLSRDALSLST